jgi:hypothetical protein
MRTAGRQWAGAMLLGLVMVTLSRRLRSAGVGVALALSTWAAAAWIARVPWPLAGEQQLVFAREGALLAAPPAPFVQALLVAAAAVLLITYVRARRTPVHAADRGLAHRLSRIRHRDRRRASCLILDLSANASFGNRYLALYHQGHLWLAMLAFSVILFLRQPLGRLLAWVLAMLDEVAERWAGGLDLRAPPRCCCCFWS